MRPFLISAFVVITIILFLIITPQAYPQTGPGISNITISNLKYNSVTISWLTNAPAVCKIVYGQTASYGITTSYSSKFVTSHQRAISGLKPYTTYHYRIIAKNKSSAITTSADFTFTTKDQYPPTGSITINNNAPYINSVEVILNISATDTGGTGLDRMYFSNDNKTWSGPIEYATKTSWKLKGGSSGSRKVYAKFTDKSGNVSSVVSDSITLDLTKPTGTIKINNNAASTTVKDVVLNLSAKDTYSGIDTTNGQMCFSNDGIAYTSPEPYKTTRNWQLEGGSGNKTVWVKFKDRAGNWSDPIADTIKYIPSDNIPPTIVLNQPSTPTNKDVTLSYTVSDNITPQDKITVTGDNSPYTQEGDYSVTLTAQDEAGNTSTSNTVKFTIDKTPPPIIITQPADGAILNTPTITLQGTIDGVSFTETRTLTEGANTITKTATDAAGNTAIKSITVTLDTVPPSIVIAQPADGALLNTPTITLQGTIDGASFSETRTLTEGKNTVTKTATDLAGNSSSSSVTVTLDTTAPEIIISQPADGAILNTPTITLQGTIDGASFSETRTLTEGKNTVTKTATDSVGNSASASITVTLDTKPPEIIITQPTDGAILNTPTITLTGTIDGTPFTEERQLTEGLNTITKTATDTAGNSASVSIMVTLDTTPPKIIITQPADGAILNTPTITLTGTIDGTPFSEQHTLQEGQNTVIKQATDAAGNTTQVSITVTLDTTPPEIIITQPTDGAILNIPTITLSGTIDGVSFTETRTLTEGANTITKTATDTAGNSASASITVTLDTQPPTQISIIINNNSTYTNSANVNLTLGATDASHILIAQNQSFTGSNWQAYSQTKSFTLSSGDGEKTVYAKFKDLAGNETQPVTDTITLDTTAPEEVTVTDDGENTPEKTKLHATWTKSYDASSGIKEYHYAIGTSSGGTDLVEWTPAGLSTEITHTGFSLTHGPIYYISVRVIDNAENVSGITSSDGIADGFPPEISSIMLTSSQNFHQGWPVTIQVNATDPEGDTIEYRYLINDYELQSWITQNQISWNPPAGNIGLNKIRVEVRAPNETGNPKEKECYIFRRPITPAQ